jgi:DNA-binding transcriptional regulator LsrR (DeoR family)
MNKTFNQICDRFETQQLRDQVNNIKGAMTLAADVARDKVLDLLNKCKDKTFVFTIDEDTDEDECLKGEIYTSYDEFNTYIIEKVKLENYSLVLIDTDGNKWNTYQIGLTLAEVLDQMVREMEWQLNNK